MAIILPPKPKTLLEETYQKFWQGFNDRTMDDEDFCREFTPHPYPSIRSYQDYHIGMPFHITIGITFDKHEIRTGAYFNDLEFYTFAHDTAKGVVENIIGRDLLWKSFKTKGRALLYDCADVDEHHGWENTYEMMIKNMLLVKKGFMLGIESPEKNIYNEDKY